MKWQAVFFDFDGVILKSVDVKTKAFAKMYRKYGPEVEQQVIKYHLENGGLPRFDKFHYYQEKLLGKKITENDIQALSVQFSNMVLQDVIDSDFIEGAYETLNNLYESKVPMYIVSGTPHKEMQIIVQKKKLSHFFIGAYGSPKKKWDIVKGILNIKGYDPLKCIFIGDAMSDYDAAQKNGMNFLGIVPEGEASPFPDGTKISSAVSLNDEKMCR